MAKLAKKNNKNSTSRMFDAKNIPVRSYVRHISDFIACSLAPKLRQRHFKKSMIKSQ